MPAARIARCSPVVPLETAEVWSLPIQSPKALLKPRQHRAERKHAAAQNFRDELLFAGADFRLAIGDRRGLWVASRSTFDPPRRCRGRNCRSSWPGCIPYSSASTSASQEASMMFSETPIAPQVDGPSDASSSTRVTAPVPFVSFRMRTLKLTRSMSLRCG